MIPSPAFTACPGCDLLLQKVEVPAGKKTYCPRCQTPLYQQKTNSVTKVLAITICGLLAYTPAIFAPLLTLDTMGMSQSGSIFDAFLNFYHHQYYFVAVMVFLTSIFFPLLKLSLLFSVALQIKLRIYTPTLPYLLRMAHHFDEWSMPEIYLIAILVTIIKISRQASIHYDLGFFCFLFLVLTTIASAAALDSRTFWRDIEKMKSLPLENLSHGQ
ncbi:MAG: paraquat-inducible protein A [Proteobacteria bacterium]|nr:paraquat-inducible protein A [Pseudomonadota bacterium]MBU1059464.1 paraquat-inducible protein A [Pseudomonadota bacterium]